MVAPIPMVITSLPSFEKPKSAISIEGLSICTGPKLNVLLEVPALALEASRTTVCALARLRTPLRSAKEPALIVTVNSLAAGVERAVLVLVPSLMAALFASTTSAPEKSGTVFDVSLSIRK